MSAIANACPVGNVLIARGIFAVPPNLLAAPSLGRLVTKRKRHSDVTDSLEAEYVDVGRRIVVEVTLAVVMVVMAVVVDGGGVPASVCCVLVCWRFC